MTSDDLAENILRESRISLWPIDGFAERQLLHRVLTQTISQAPRGASRPAEANSALVELLVEHIQELKRRGIEPAALAKSTNRRRAEDAFFAQVYLEYQARLTELNLADHEGRHWIARDQLAAGCCPSLDALDLVVLDGFTDFNPTQHDMLHSLADRSQELLISLPGDVEFARTGKTPTNLLRETMAIRPAGETICSQKPPRHCANFGCAIGICRLSNTPRAP
jgi:ATP-dependent helicase/DNAse subunit B